MADLTKSTSPPPSTVTLTPNPAGQLTKVAASGGLTAGDMVYINSSGEFAKTNGTSNGALAQWFGMVVRDAAAGQPVTAFNGVEIRYAASGLTPGARYYVSTNAGLLSDSATTGGDVMCAFATSATEIFVSTPRK